MILTLSSPSFLLLAAWLRQTNFAPVGQKPTHIPSVAFCRLVIRLVVVYAILSSVKMMPVGVRLVVIDAYLEVSQDVAD